MSVNRHRTGDPTKIGFQCIGYKQRTTSCTVHYIRERVLEKIVLINLKRMTAFAREQPEQFYEAAMQKGRAEAEKIYASANRRKAAVSDRINKLNNIIRCLYEDRVVGRISPERYDELAVGYEQEQAELKKELENINENMQSLDAQEKLVNEFMENARQFIEMPKLTPELLHTFIKRIEVYEKPVKYSHKFGNPIIIYYTFEMTGMERFSVLLGENETD